MTDPTVSLSITTPIVEAVDIASAQVLTGRALRDVIHERIEQLQKHGFTPRS